MADPIAYDVSYDFSGYQATFPNLPLPAAELDTELANIEASLDSIVVALAEVRRADGMLQNGIVDVDSLDPQVLAALQATERVLTIDLDPASFANQPVAEAGIANGVLMTPLRTKQALDAQRAFASQAEAEAGALATKVSSPLAVKQALDVLRAFASQAEAEAGTEAAKVSSPLTVKQALDALRPALTATAVITWGGITTLAGSTQTIAVAGAAVGDRVVIGYPAAGVNDGLIARAWVSATDVVSIRLFNTTAGTITPTAGTTWKVTVLKF